MIRFLFFAAFFFFIYFLVLSILLAAPAHSQESTTIGTPSAYLGATYILIRETEEPGAVAELLYFNADVNDPSDELPYTVILEREGQPDIEVTVRFFHNVGPGGPDRIEIIAPPGLMAIPPEITLMEGYSEISLLYPEGMS